ncbi:MAG: transcriptional regulator [Acidobacteriota bacterium]
MTPEQFLVTHHVFTRRELAEALRDSGTERSPRTLSSHLQRWQRRGRITQVKRGLYVRQEAADSPIDLLLVASRMAWDAALAYHTALEAHGFAQSYFEKLFFVTWTKTKPLTFRGRDFVPVRPSVALRKAGRRQGWTETLERRGSTVRVTTLERTVADVLHRSELAGGLEEAWRSCSAIPGLDLRELEAYVKTLDSRVLGAKVGFFLERHKDELAVSSSLLERLRSLAPRVPVYMDRGRRGKRVPQWNLLAPVELLEGEWESVA